MNTEIPEQLTHDHTFGQDLQKPGERLTLMVIVITALTMILEIGAGLAFGSMALLADGLHMGSHAMALGIAALAYAYTRRHAADQRFSFGTGKVNSLAGFASAVLLIVFALVMTGESINRLINPVFIVFDQAILVAVIGLAVNGVSLLILSGKGHEHHPKGGKDHHHPDNGPLSRQDLKKDHNLWSAYLHVAADALTSFLAIFALLAGKYLELNWLDLIMGVVGAVLVSHWSVGLIRSTSRILLDMRAPAEIREGIVRAVEKNSKDRVIDLHVWAVGPEIYAAEIAVLTPKPRDQRYYQALLDHENRLAHVTWSVQALPSA